MAAVSGMLTELAHVARTIRKARRIRLHRVAKAAGLSAATVSRFERARAWPRDPDQLIDAYAEVADVDAAEIWRAASRAYARASGRDQCS